MTESASKRKLPDSSDSDQEPVDAIFDLLRIAEVIWFSGLQVFRFAGFQIFRLSGFWDFQAGERFL